MVRLRRRPILRILENRCVFTIHYGEIKTPNRHLQVFPLLQFTIHYGEIKTSSCYMLPLHNLDLQSTMVRLRPRIIGLHYFTSIEFTIHYGEIKTDILRWMRYGVHLFTIHYGEIKTVVTMLRYVRHIHLQSTMVRLRRQETPQYWEQQNYLQSTMVRLRQLRSPSTIALIIVFTIHYGEIKTRMDAKRVRRCYKNLQSTMVRLRRC